LEIHADALDEVSLKHSIETVIDGWGHIDGLVNNVGGLTTPSDFERLSSDNWVDVFRLNVVAPATAIRLCLPHLKGHPSSVINIASFVAHQPGKWNPHYSSSKAALINLTKHLASLYGSEGVRVNSISPGHIETETWFEGLAERARERDVPVHEVVGSERLRIEQSVPMQRLGQPDEVATVVEFLLSPQSRYVTGVDIRVDGGKVSYAQLY
jgi:3-oxoacyl-[acyl-carrier protein] reductase